MILRDIVVKVILYNFSVIMRLNCCWHGHWSIRHGVSYGITSKCYL